MSTGAQALTYFLALLLFLFAAGAAWRLEQPRRYWPTLIALGLACWTAVYFWNALVA